MTPQIITPTIPELVKGFFHLLYPDLCVACRFDLPTKGSCFCLKCQLKITPFPLENPHDNDFTARLWGRLPLEWGIAAYHFTRKGPVQRALHQLKYHNRPEIGQMFGRELGKRMRQVPMFKSLHGIVPVPLHPKKERIRGYNQSDMFANGLAEALEIPVFNQALRRRAFTSSQTNKKRMERFQNVGDVFEAFKTTGLHNKHLLLVDDVLTTGATLELCGQALLDIPDLRLSLATIAIADL